MAALTLKAPDKARAALSKRPEFVAFKAAQKTAQKRAETEWRADMRRQWLDQAIPTRRELRRRFPNCFQPYGCTKFPLKIGIDADLAERAPDIGPWSRTCAIQNYVGEEAYLAAMIEGAARLDLDGNPAGIVTAHAARHAAARLAKIAARREQRKREAA